MDIAVFSDIHGNYAAFQKCLEYAVEKNIDTFVFLGDYLGEFPYPQKTMDILYSVKAKYQCFFIKGNKEDYWINRKNGNGVEWKSGSSSTGALQYCYSELTDRDIEFFESMPICSEISFEGAEAILVCHGSPNRNNEKMLPNNENTKAVIERCKTKYLLCGHTHVQQSMEYEGKVVLNPGAVGVSLHGDGKSQFMILHSHNKEWEYEFVNLDYDKELVRKDMQESGLDNLAPYWSKITLHLLETGEISHGAVLARAMQYCIEETGDCKWYDVPEKYWEKAVKELIMKIS